MVLSPRVVSRTTCSQASHDEEKAKGEGSGGLHRFSLAKSLS